jgi:hypothetical protein
LGGRRKTLKIKKLAVILENLGPLVALPLRMYKY